MINKRWLITIGSLLIVAAMLLSGSYSLTHAYFYDVETASGNVFQAWVSKLWTWNTQPDFEAGGAGVRVNVDTSSSPGDVKLQFVPGGGGTTITNSPSSSTTPGWNNPANAYADGGGYASIMSGTPSASETYGNYGFNLTGYFINTVRVRYDAWSGGGGTPVLYEYYDTGHNASAEIYSNNIAAQTFSSNVNITITSAAMLLFRRTGYTGTITAAIYNTAGTSPNYYPTGSALTSGTTDGSTLPNSGNVNPPPGGAEWRTITFTTPLTLTANTTYALVLSATGGDNNTNVLWRYNSSGTYPRGMYGRTTTGTWDATKMVSTSDFMFRTYGYSEYDDQIRVDVSWNGGTTWSTTQNTTLTRTETTYWYNVTGATAWDATKLNNSNLKVRVVAYTQGTAAEEVRLDWLPVEVTYYTSGVYTSPGTIASDVKNAGLANATWDLLFWGETLPSGTDITFEVRAQNTPFNPGDATPAWTSLGAANSPVTSGLPSGQYKQWRATLTTSNTTVTPVLHEVRVWYDP